LGSYHEKSVYLQGCNIVREMFAFYQIWMSSSQSQCTFKVNVDYDPEINML